MLETVVVCSMVSSIFSVLTFLAVMLFTDDKDRRTIMRLTRELTDTKRDLTECRAELIKANSDRAFYADRLYGSDDVDINELLEKF